jgi:putative membrane protein
MMGYGWGMSPVGWILMGLFWILLVGLVIWAAITLLPGARAAVGPAHRETPEEILARRFAQGEISVEQYRQARDELAAAPRPNTTKQ